MFSSRLNWGLPLTPLARLLDEKRSRGEAILDLTESNPTLAGLAYPADRILAALGDARALRYEPSPIGLAAARGAISEYYSGCVAPERILVTASTSEGYAFLFKLLCDPGDEVLVPRPSYPLFEFLAELDSVRVANYPLAYYRGWAIDFDALASSVTERTRAVVVVNPNNPTGTFLKKDELAQLVALCRARNLALISDEVFADYGWEEDSRRVRSLIDTEGVVTFSLSGLSKVAGLPQLKLGWIVTNGPAVERAQALENLELIADTYLSVGTPVLWAAASLLDTRKHLQAQILERVRANRDFLAAQIGPASPWRLLDAEGGWYAIIEAPRIRSEEEWALALLAEDHVLIQPGFFFDFESEAFLVMSLLTRPEIFHEGVRRVLARVV
jgi:alanine-synthesizing transaminase